jgi:hypothetical protein
VWPVSYANAIHLYWRHFEKEYKCSVASSKIAETMKRRQWLAHLGERWSIPHLGVSRTSRNDFDYDGWVRIGFALYDGLGDSGRDLWESWSAKSSKNDPALTASKGPSFAKVNRVTVGTLFYEARRCGWKESRRQRRDNRQQAGGEQTAEGASELPLIRVVGGELSALATRAEDLLITAGVPIYQRGGRLVRPIIEDVDASRGRRTKTAQLVALDSVYARDLNGTRVGKNIVRERGSTSRPIRLMKPQAPCWPAHSSLGSPGLIGS